jgi:hypothetical protein
MRLITILFFYCLYSLNAQSQDPGIFLTAGDFVRGTVSYPKMGNKRYRLYLHELFNTALIKIVSGKQTIVLKKDSVFGYRDAKDNNYRFYERGIYQILNPGEKIILYARSSCGGYKNTEAVTRYFFSVDACSPVYPLSIVYLKTVFSKDTIFYELLDIYFRRDDELLSFNYFHGVYQLNHVAQLSDLLIKSNKK